MSESSRATFDKILRADFNSFSERAYNVLSLRHPFVSNWHLVLLAATLEAVRHGKIRRLIINLPPRSLKSHTASVAFVAWLLGHDPAIQLLCVSNGQDLADKLARDCLRLMTSPFFQALFPACRLSASKQAVGEFETTAGGGRQSVSIDGQITGFGADIIIVDDPHKPGDMNSDAKRTAVNRLFDNTICSRLNNKATGAIIIVMQRLHLDDLVGHVLKQEEWTVLSFPAIALHDEVFEIDTPYGPHTYRRKTGSEEQEVKAAWFPRFDLIHPPEFDRIIQSWDTAIKTGEANDFSVCTTWGVKGKDYYLLDVQRRRMTFTELIDSIRIMASRRRPSNVLIEDAPPSGSAAIDDLRNKKMRTVTPCKPNGGDKAMRLRAEIAIMEAGFVHLPTEAPWLEAYLNELTTFPRAEHDDQVDSTTQALAWLKGPGDEPSELTAIKREAAKLHESQTQMRRFQVPNGGSHIYRVDGSRYEIDANNTILCTEEEARGFRRSRWKELDL